MNRFHFLIGFIIVVVFGILFVVSQYSNEEAKKQNEQNGNKSLLNPLVTDTFQDVNLSPQANGQLQGQQTAQTQPTAGVLEPLNASIAATIKTSKGDIEITLFGDEAENTVRNFMTKAQTGFYNNLIFHRVEDWVIQGGDPQGNGTGGGMMKTEINDKPFVVGSVGVARAGNPQISNDAQFFITKTDASHLNNQYTNFGIVTKGMDVVKKIEIGDKILGITVEK